MDSSKSGQGMTNFFAITWGPNDVVKG